MIVINKALRHSRCICCNSDDGVKDVCFCNAHSQSVAVILCRNCRKTLITKLVDELTEPKEE